MSTSVRSSGPSRAAALAKRLRTARIAVTVGVHGGAGQHSNRRQNLTKKAPRPARKTLRKPLLGRFKRALKKLAGLFRGRPRKKEAKPTKGSKSISLGELAAIHEYGIGVPMRSFIRSWARGPDPKPLLRRVAVALANGRIGKAQAQRLMGEILQASCQKNVSDGIPPPNAASTVKRKGSSKPLIDTGQLRGSITWKGST